MAVEVRTVGEAAEALGVSAGTVRNWVDKGYIQAFRFPSGVRRIPESEVRRLIAATFGVSTSEWDGGDLPKIRLGEVADDRGEPAV